MTRGQLCVGWTTVLGTVAGIALLIIGGIHVANAPDATDDFRTLASPCVVVGVYYMGTTTVSRHNHASKKTDTYCYDQYTYEFAWCQDNTACAPSAAPSSLGNTAPRAGYAPSWSSTATEVTVYRDWWSSFPPPATFATSNTGWESSLLVSGVDMVMRGFGACSTQQQQNSTHDAGDWVTCYQPNGLPVDAAYRCGNPSCIKVRDPALELWTSTTYDTLYFGAGVAGLFSLSMLCMWRSRGCCRALLCDKDDDEWSSEEPVKA